jgi:hypothetical protein
MRINFSKGIENIKDDFLFQILKYPAFPTREGRYSPINIQEKFICTCIAPSDSVPDLGTCKQIIFPQKDIWDSWINSPPNLRGGVLCHDWGKRTAID